MKRSASSAELNLESDLRIGDQESRTSGTDVGADDDTASVIRVCTLSEAIAWAPRLWKRLKAQIAIPSVDLVQNALQRLKEGLWLTTDFSGMGGAEMSLEELLRTRPREVDAEVDVTVARACDSAAPCQETLTTHLGACRPECVFVDMLARVSTTLLDKVTALQDQMRANAEKAKLTGMSEAEANEKYGKQLWTKADDVNELEETEPQQPLERKDAISIEATLKLCVAVS